MRGRIGADLDKPFAAVSAQCMGGHLLQSSTFRELTNTAKSMVFAVGPSGGLCPALRGRVTIIQLDPGAREGSRLTFIIIRLLTGHVPSAVQLGGKTPDFINQPRVLLVGIATMGRLQ